MYRCYTYEYVELSKCIDNSIVSLPPLRIFLDKSTYTRFPSLNSYLGLIIGIKDKSVMITIAIILMLMISVKSVTKPF